MEVNKFDQIVILNNRKNKSKLISPKRIKIAGTSFDRRRKYSDERVKERKELHSNGWTCGKIGRKFGMRECVVKNIVKDSNYLKSRWKSVNGYKMKMKEKLKNMSKEELKEITRKNTESMRKYKNWKRSLVNLKKI